MTLSAGSTFIIHGEPHSIECLLGRGAQGVVWALRRADPTGRLVALKWYHRQQATHERKAHLQWLIKGGSPSKRFAWPESIVTIGDEPGFGFVMPIAAEGSRPLAEAGPSLEPALALAAAMELALAVAELHLHGLCHRDLSLANTLFDRSEAKLTIIDNDTAGTRRHPGFGVRGTRSAADPEVYAGGRPADAANDRYALAVMTTRLLDPHLDSLGRARDLLRAPPSAAPEPLEWVEVLRRDKLELGAQL